MIEIMETLFKSFSFHITKCLGKIYPHVDFRIVFRVNKPIGSLFPFKDRVSSRVYSSVVYKVTCSSCQATCYGKTSRHFIVHCIEHLGINKKGNSVKGASSAITRFLLYKEPGQRPCSEKFLIFDHFLPNFSTNSSLIVHQFLLQI